VSQALLETEDNAKGKTQSMSFPTRRLSMYRTDSFLSRVTKIHVEKLEEKLDGLVNLLKMNREAEAARKSPIPAHHVEIDGPNQAMRSISISASSSDPAHQEFRGLQQQLVAHSQSSIAEPLWGQPTAVTSLSASPTNGACEIGDDEANSILSIFRDEMCQAFPFIVIHDSTSAQDLRRDRPFLFLSILAVASRNGPQQLELGKSVMKQLAERMFVNGERNLDLLLGILTYAGWSVAETGWGYRFAN
jgi:hypothetical protein